MAKKVAGEVDFHISSKKTVTLRLDIGTMMELEDYFGKGGALILAEELRFLKLRDLSILYLAMTGGDWRSDDAIKGAATEIAAVGVPNALGPISECLALLFIPNEAGEPPRGKRKVTNRKK